MSGAPSPFQLPPRLALVDEMQRTKEQTEATGSRRSTKKGDPWSETEHTQFLHGLRALGKGQWKQISKYYVPTRTATQVASHAQKHFLRVSGATKRRSRFTAMEQVLFANEKILASAAFASALSSAAGPGLGPGPGALEAALHAGAAGGGASGAELAEGASPSAPAADSSGESAGARAGADGAGGAPGAGGSKAMGEGAAGAAAAAALGLPGSIDFLAQLGAPWSAPPGLSPLGALPPGLSPASLGSGLNASSLGGLSGLGSGLMPFLLPNMPFGFGMATPSGIPMLPVTPGRIAVSFADDASGAAEAASSPSAGAAAQAASLGFPGVLGGGGAGAPGSSAVHALQGLGLPPGVALPPGMGLSALVMPNAGLLGAFGVVPGPAPPPHAPVGRAQGGEEEGSPPRGSEGELSGEDEQAEDDGEEGEEGA